MDAIGMGRIRQIEVFIEVMESENCTPGRRGAGIAALDRVDDHPGAGGAARGAAHPPLDAAMVATVEGRAFLRHAREIVDAVDDVEQASAHRPVRSRDVCAWTCRVGAGGGS
jgi:hypothetical protein